MDWKEQSQAPPSLIGKEAKLLPGPPGQALKSRRAFFRVMTDIWHAVKGYTADDITRLKEGGVQQIEGKGQLAIAEAKAKIAEAAERHAKAEQSLAEAAKAKAEAYAIRKRADGEFAKNVAEATKTVTEAVSRIRQQGGNVSYDMVQIERLLLQGKSEFPADRQIAAAASEAESANDPTK